MNTESSLKATDQPVGVYIGWDWADKKHDVCLRLPGQKSGDHKIIDNTPEAVHGFLKDIHTQFPRQQIVLAIESSRSALLPIFEQYASWLTLYSINPATAAKYREVFHPSKVKTDALDCSLLADIVIAHPDKLFIHIPQDAQTLEIETMVEDRRKLVDRRTAIANELKSRLKSYFPQALDFISDATTHPFAAAFLLKWACLEALQKSKPQDIRRFYRANRRQLTEKLQALLVQLPTFQSPSQKTCRIEPAVFFVQILSKELDCLHTAISAYDKRIAVRVSEHPTLPLIESLPGAGATLQARLVAVLGRPDALQASGNSPYRNADDLAILTGIAPVVRRSGKSSVTLCRKAFSHFSHQTFMEFSKQSIVFGQWANAYHQFKESQGWKYWRIVRALAYKWIRILVAVLKSGIAYDEALYVKQLREKNCPYMNAFGCKTATS